MPGSLIKIAETTVSSSTASVTLTGIDSTYDVYKLVWNNVSPTTNEVDLRARVTESGTPNTTSNYDRAVIGFRANASFLDLSSENDSSWDFGNNTGTGTSETTNGHIYIFNANNSSEYTLITFEIVEVDHSQTHLGMVGGMVFTSASAVDGIQLFFDSSSDTETGTFKLYGLKK
tara:strand:+ start:132 stop:653 length:522 start_codon:yes stop_codon:yes gene_type:complete